MIDHVLGRPSTKSRRLQVLAVLSFWSAVLFKSNKHGPPGLRTASRWLSRRLTAWQTVVITMIYLYAVRNSSTLVGLSSPEPLANMYETTYFRATWVLTALDAGFWTAMKIPNKTVRDLASIVFTVFYLFQTGKADEKVRKIRSNLTVEHLRTSWNKSVSPYLSFLQGLLRPRFMRWPPRQIRIPRPSTSDYKEPVSGWLYFDGPLSELAHHDKIVLDIPGGGFVAMDPRCNDDRLLAWAAKTGLPILSLDYKKAPEFPYPHALNECYDAYTTIINTKGRCIGLPGTEVPKVVICGDSAGGNLAASTTLMIIESGSSTVRRTQGQTDLPLPDAVILFYPGLDMNIGNWMSDEQMSLMKDRRTRGTNRRVVRRKSMQYTNLVGTPHHSDDEDETAAAAAASTSANGASQGQSKELPPLATESNGENGEYWPVRNTEQARSPHPEFAHPAPTTWSKVTPQQPTSPEVSRSRPPGTSHRAEPMRTRLATSSMISYFNDRILTPEMMRAMIILYIGPHNRPDFSTDYLLSPVLAPDVLLARFPKTYFLTGERDPLVDDTVIFAGRLRRVKAAVFASGGRRFDYQDDDCLASGFDEKEVAETVLIPGISHGFMQFPALYPPAWKWIDRSAEWIEEAFASSEKRGRTPVAGTPTAGLGLRMSQIGSPVETNGATGSTTVNGGGGGEEGLRSGRHHFRAESSGDEDRPLEMTMVRPKGKPNVSAAGAAAAARAGNGSAGNVSKADDKQPGNEGGDAPGAASQSVNGNGSPKSGANAKKKKSNGSSTRGRKSGYADTSLNRLASSDDLLGRRMQGLAGGLTGPIEEE